MLAPISPEPEWHRPGSGSAPSGWRLASARRAARQRRGVIYERSLPACARSARPGADRRDRCARVGPRRNASVLCCWSTGLPSNSVRGQASRTPAAMSNGSAFDESLHRPEQGHHGNHRGGRNNDARPVPGLVASNCACGQKSQRDDRKLPKLDTDVEAGQRR